VKAVGIYYHKTNADSVSKFNYKILTKSFAVMKVIRKFHQKCNKYMLNDYLKKECKKTP